MTSKCELRRQIQTLNFLIWKILSWLYRPVTSRKVSRSSWAGFSQANSMPPQNNGSKRARAMSLISGLERKQKVCSKPRKNVKVRRPTRDSDRGALVYFCHFLAMQSDVTCQGACIVHSDLKSTALSMFCWNSCKLLLWIIDFTGKSVVCMLLWFSTVPRPSTPPVFDLFSIQKQSEVALGIFTRVLRHGLRHGF